MRHLLLLMLLLSPLQVQAAQITLSGSTFWVNARTVINSNFTDGVGEITAGGTGVMK